MYISGWQKKTMYKTQIKQSFTPLLNTVLCDYHFHGITVQLYKRIHQLQLGMGANRRTRSNDNKNVKSLICDAQ